MKKTALLFTLLLVSCGTSPEPKFYGLSKIDGPQVQQNISIKVQRPTLPEYLDRPDIVRGEDAYQYKVDEMHRWAEPLDQMFERILTEDLQQRLPGNNILSESDTGTVDLRYVVETNISQFNAIDHGHAALKLEFSIADRSKAKSFEQQSMEVVLPYNGGDEGLAAALSKLIGLYANRIVDVLDGAPKN